MEIKGIPCRRKLGLGIIWNNLVEAPARGIWGASEEHLSGLCGSWAAGPRSAADLKKAATHKDRAAALHPAPAGKAKLTGDAERYRRQAEAIWKPCDVRAV